MVCGRKWHFKLEKKKENKKKKKLKLKKLIHYENIPNEVDKIIKDAEKIKSKNNVVIYKNA